LRYNSFQIQDNLTFFRGAHTITTGVSFERYRSENVFFPGSQSVYVYNSLADFFTDANGFLANPNRTTSPVSLRRFQVRWSNVPGLEKPIQPLKVVYTGLRPGCMEAEGKLFPDVWPAYRYSFFWRNGLYQPSGKRADL
jgi:hypothetical protein